MVGCSALGCTNSTEKGHKVFRVPWDPQRKMQWAVALRRKQKNGDLWIPGVGARVCSAHFVEEKRSDDPSHVDYVPSIFSYNNDSRARSRRRIEMHHRHAAISRKRLASQEQQASCSSINTAVESLDDMDSMSDVDSMDAAEGSPTGDNMVDAEVQATESTGMCANCYSLVKERDALSDEVSTLRRRCRRLKAKLNTCQDVGQMSEKKVTFYTGLTKATFLAVLAAVVAALPPARKCLPHPSQLLLFLMRLRLGLHITDLAYRFHVSVPTASRIFKDWLAPMSSVCRQLIVFPDPDIARSWLTTKERHHFPNLRGIIDCTEVPVSRPFNLSTQQEVWSNYKQGSTLKFLVCVNTHGAITFVSPVYGGRISDKEITLQSGFLGMLLPGDQILADRGFLLHEEFFLRDVQLITPAFTKGRTQLLHNEVESSRRISSSRIIVERAIGHIKKWRILTNTVPYHLVQDFDNILSVVAGLTNFSLSLANKAEAPTTGTEHL
ncbi:uncharacterized protein LOC135372806 [Ornithodoros turicata]|uniref:uncharacterized protein LOC135372806 n=1 Tax=Ornithodoros turicata TaxID=34597 RepID=UPI0031389367